jgi:hypothetical protein
MKQFSEFLRATTAGGDGTTGYGADFGPEHSSQFSVDHAFLNMSFIPVQCEFSPSNTQSTSTGFSRFARAAPILERLQCPQM